jgi:hypothetical protein
MEDLDTVEAFTEKPDGSKVPVGMANIITRDAASGLPADAGARRQCRDVARICFKGRRDSPSVIHFTHCFSSLVISCGKIGGPSWQPQRNTFPPRWQLSWRWCYVLPLGLKFCCSAAPSFSRLMDETTRT